MGSYTPAPTTALAPGDRLDRYELLCVLAHGGMGTVWLARMTGKHGFERLVALKTVLQSYTHDRQFCDMFLDEARIAAQIDHENVARILEIGEDRSILYYAMELIDGESLRKLYRDVRGAGQAFPMPIALRVTADACAGLHATHELRGPDGVPLDVVHRDVSPQNLLISVRGTTKLIDFGVAKARARRSEETAAGTLKGKIEYMAPEQARGDPLDRRADVYSLGAVLYELLAGRPVRDTDEGKQLAALHDLMTGAPFPPLPPTVPAPVRAIVDRALAREPRARFATAEELRAALEKAMATLGQRATTDDVAKMMGEYSRERLAKRKGAMEAAVRAAEEGRLNAATIVAPVQQVGSAPSFDGAGPASSPAGALGYDRSGPYPLLPPAAPSGPSGVFGAAAAPSARSVGGEPVTGPSMRTNYGAALTAPPAGGRGSAAKVAVAGVVLALVALLGVGAGVLVTRKIQPAAASPAATSAPDEGSGAAAATATATPADTAADTAARPAVVPTAPPTGLVETLASAKAAGADAGPSAATSATPPTSSPKAGEGRPRGTTNRATGRSGSKSETDEYGF